jgi:hypothetical protein
VPGRVDRIVVDDRVARCPGADRRHLELFVANLAAVPFRAFGQDVDRPEQAEGERAAVALGAGHDALAVEQARAFMGGKQRVGRRVARLHEAAGIGADEAAIVADVVDVLHPHDMHRGVTRDRLVLMGALLGQQVLEVDLQAVADIGAQHDRPRPLVLAQRDVAGGERRPLGLRLAGGGVDHVAPQGIDHAGGVRRPEAVVEEGLVEGDHVGGDGAGAGLLRPRLAGGQRDRVQDRRCNADGTGLQTSAC